MIKIEVESKGFNSDYDLTDLIQNELEYMNSLEGILKVCAVGSTVGITVMRYEEGAVKDLLNCLEVIVPEDGNYEHFRTTKDPNGFAHVKSSFLGTSLCLPYLNGTLALPQNHKVVMFDFDLQSSIRKLYISD